MKVLSYILKKPIEKVKLHFNSNKVLLLMEFELSSYLGCYLRSSIFNTNVLFKSGQNLSLAVLNEVRRVKLMDQYLNVPPNMFYLEHLREMIVVYSKLNSNDAVAGECVLKDEVVFLPDMRSMYSYYCPDMSLLDKFYFTPLVVELPKFIMDYTHPIKDFIEIEENKFIAMTSQPYQVFRYWNILTSYVSDELFGERILFTRLT